jgi:hypothetical protein
MEFLDPAWVVSLRWLLELVAFAGVLGLAVYLPLRWSRIPKEVPIHFGITGRPDRWGHPGWLVVLVFGGVMGYGILSGVGDTLGLLVAAAPRNQLDALMAAWTKAVMVPFFVFLLHQSVLIGQQRAERLSVFVMPLLVAAIFAPIALRKLLA